MENPTKPNIPMQYVIVTTSAAGAGGAFNKGQILKVEALAKSGLAPSMTAPIERKRKKRKTKISEFINVQ